MTSQTIEQKIPFGVQEVKDALNTILTRFKSTYLNQQVNDLFCTYTFGTLGCIYNINLNDAGESHTLVKITCSARGSERTTSSASVSAYITEFTNVLTAQLEGKSDEEMSEIVNKNCSSKSDGGMQGLLQFIIIILSIIAIYYAFSI